MNKYNNYDCDTKIFFMVCDLQNNFLYPFKLYTFYAWVLLYAYFPQNDEKPDFSLITKYECVFRFKLLSLFYFTKIVTFLSTSQK